MIRVPGNTKFLSRHFAVAFLFQLIFLSSLIIIPERVESSDLDDATFAGLTLKQTPILDPGDLPAISDYRPSFSLLAQAGIPVSEEDPHGEEQKSLDQQKPAQPVTRLVPIWGEKVRGKGFDLPLPFGVGANLVFMDQGIKLRSVKVGIGDPIFDVSGLSFKDARSHDRANTARVDMWLLPFANIYGIFGYINGEAELDLDIGQITGSLPPIGFPPIFEPGKTIDLNIDYNGTTFGGGVTLAGGYKHVFGSLDANYTYSNIDVVDGKIRTYTISPRLGLLVDSTVIPGSLAFWIGGMYMRYKQTVTDDINLQELDSRLPSVELDFKLKVENEQPWNFLFGGQWEITKRWQFMVEGGVGDRKQVITGLYFRF